MFGFGLYDMMPGNYGGETSAKSCSIAVPAVEGCDEYRAIGPQVIPS